jgi:hypothetical protein
MSDGEIITAQAGFIGTEWEDSDYEMFLNLSGVAPNFRSEIGYVRENDFLGAGGGLTRKFYPESELVHRVELTPADAFISWHTDGRLKKASLGPGISTQLSSNIYLHVAGGYSGELYEGEWLNNRDLLAFVGGSPSRHFSLHMMGGAGTTTLYDQTSPRSVQYLVTEGKCSVALGRQFTVSARLSLQRLADMEELIDLSWVSRLQGDFFFTRQLWTRVNLDISAGDVEQAFEGLIAWEKTPGRALYFGMANPALGVDDWQLFAKASWVFDR